MDAPHVTLSRKQQQQAQQTAQCELNGVATELVEAFLVRTSELVGPACRFSKGSAKQHGVRIRTTNIDANPQRAHDGTSSIGTQGPSYPKRSGPAISRPRGVRQTSAHGMPITVTRWP